ncbi:AAA family ATPase [Streptomyces sp. NPDC046939]|uniref:ATP-binding protein n=1 Tax=Streptomyces sp. NPDC046939 TaxID=3155376 RepID=UPI0033D1C1E7
MKAPARKGEHSTVLLERDNDVRSVRAALDAADGGRGALLVVRGRLGAGKSELLEAVGDLGADRGALVLRAQGAPSETEFGFGVVRQLIEPVLSRVPGEEARALFRGTAEGARAVLAEDAPAVRPTPWPAEELNRALAGLTALVAGLARDRTVVLLVDDVHWADAESLRMLWHLARTVPVRRILLVCGVLAGDLRAEQPLVREVLALARHTVVPADLGHEGTRSLVEEYLGAPADDTFVRACRERSGGNPLFLTSVLAEAVFHGLRPLARHAADVAALRPALLRQRLRLHLDALPGHVRKAAFAVTALDRDTAPHLLDELTELDAVRRAEALRVLRENGLVTEVPHPAFTSSVVRDAVEESVPPAERAALRALTAELLHRSGHPAEQAAEHLMNVVTPQDRDALHLLRTAADSALRRGAPRDAARYLRRALLDSASAGPDRARLLIDLATVERSFATTPSVRHVMEAVPMLSGVRERAAALTRLGPALMAPVAFPVDDMVRRVAAELAASGTADAVDEELALRLEARERLLGSQDPGRVKASLRRLADLGPRPSMDSAGRRELLTVLIHIAGVTNSVPAAELADLATRLLEHEPPSPAHTHTALPLALNVLAAADRTEGVASWLREAYRSAESRRGDVEMAVIRAEQALIALAEGDMAGARERLWETDGPADAEPDGLPAVSAAVLAVVALRTAAPELAERILTRHGLHEENQYLAALVAMAKGHVAARAGDHRAALDHYLMAGHRQEQIGWDNPVILPWAGHAALMHRRLGDTATAVGLSRREVERSRAWGAPSGLGRALVMLGRVTPGRRGTELLEEAVDLLEGAGPYELCLALHALGRRVEPRQRARGRALLRRALGLSIECGATWLHESMRGHAGERAPARPASGASLTPSEHKVARLAASGLRNQEIAEELSISVRAVEKHLTNSYRKLGIKGRPDLSAALPDAGPA